MSLANANTLQMNVNIVNADSRISRRSVEKPDNAMQFHIKALYVVWSVMSATGLTAQLDGVLTQTS